MSADRAQTFHSVARQPARLPFRPSSGRSSRNVGGSGFSVGGSLESYYFAFGDDSYFITIDMPDDETAASVALTVGASGAVVVSTIKLLTPEQVDVAVKRSPTYRAPGH